jgi:polyhydroxybutyrate depolymerase
LLANVDGDERRVRVYAPDPMPSGDLPLVIFLHPFGGTPASAAEETGFGDLAGAEGFIAAFPPAEQAAWAAQVTQGLSDRDTDSVFLAGLVDRLVEAYPVDPARTYVAGFSMGAVMAGRVACEHADRFAAAMLDAGAPWIGECRPSEPISVLIIHGTGDGTFRFDRAKAMATDWIERDGCTGAAAEITIGDDATASLSADCRQGTAVEFIAVDNGPHAWFRTPDATGLAWGFFAEHGRR